MMGIVEVVTHLGPLAKRLRKTSGADSVILVDKSYRAQLTRAQTGKFLEDYYLVHGDASAQNIQLLESMGEHAFTRVNPIQILDDQIMTQYLLQDSLGRLMGYWLTFEDKAVLDLTEVGLFKKQYSYGFLVLVILSLLLILLYQLQRKAEAGRNYYRSILDATSDIVLVTKGKQLIDANVPLFEFFSEYINIKDFLKHHDCVCHTFEPGAGLLQKYMFGEFWIDYVLQHPEKEHIAKIMRQGKEHYFRVKAAVVQSNEEGLVSIIMHDMTEQQQYKKRLEKQAETDELTGIANRLVFNRKLSEEVTRAHRYQNPLCLAIFDIDLFKSVNDEFGHDVGDEVLRTISSVVSSLLRETDIFCRIGGEEFAIVMPETELKDARVVSERLRKSVAELSEELVPKPLTVSVGLSHMTRWDSNKSLFKKSDKALYQAKDSGRNQVITAEDEQSS
jgi:diguanylate cyclase (GGDEF)-like protein